MQKVICQPHYKLYFSFFLENLCKDSDKYLLLCWPMSCK